MNTMPTRVDDDLFAAAKTSGKIHSRSASQQVTHWARIGRALESSGAVSHRDIERVLAGAMAYDDLQDREQAVVRAEWAERITGTIAELNFSDEFTDAGESWSETDQDGNVVIRTPGQTS